MLELCNDDRAGSRRDDVGNKELIAIWLKASAEEERVVQVR